MTAKSASTLKSQFQDVDPEQHNTDIVDSVEAAIGMTASETELNYLDGATPGTVVASKAIIVNANKHIDTLVVADGGLSLGSGTGTAITSTAAELNNLDGVSAGTAAASKAAVLGSNKELDEVHAEALYVGSGAGTQVTSTAAQLNKIAGDGVVVVDKTQVDASGGGSADTTSLTTLAAGSVLYDVLAVVDTAFDGDATQTLEVGVSGNSDKYIDTNDFDPSASAGTSRSMMQRATSGTAGSNDQTSVEYISSETSLIATWTNTASATAGKVTVYVQYADMS